MARVYLGPGGGGAICDPDDAAKPRRPARPPAETALLDPGAKLVPVARPEEFVGRRRQIQAVLRAFGGGSKGVVVHGMGNLGKSSLAARVADRMRRRHGVAAVFGEASARTIFAALRRAGEQVADAMEDFTAAQNLQTELEAMDKAVAADPGALGTVARRLLRGLFNEHPLLLVLDDFERSLEPPTAEAGEVAPKTAFGPALQALLGAFAEAHTAARLLVTSRYDFVLRDGAGTDLTAALARVPLAPMGPEERKKQWRARLWAADREETAAQAQAEEVLAAALEAAGGNPGLQEVLTRPILAGEPDQAKAAVAKITTFRAEGKAPPPGDDVGDFFARMAFESYRSALSEAEARQLSAATLFAEGVPIPRAAMAAAGAANGVEAPERAVARLLGLGLFDDHGPIAGAPHVAANPLARPLAAPLDPDDTPRLAGAALGLLADAWRDETGDFPYDSRGVEAARIAWAAHPGDPDLLDRAATAAVIFLFERAHDARDAMELG